MDFILTLIASEKPLNAAHLAVIVNYLDEQGIAVSGEPAWMTPHKAADMVLFQRPDYGQMRAMRELLAADRIDILLNRLKPRRKKLLLADMDATILTGETLDELAGHIGRKEETAVITERTMRGELDFATSLRERVSLLRGLGEDTLQETMNNASFSPGAQLMVNAMAEKGCICVLVSGGFTFFTGAVADKMGFHHHHGNTLEIENGVLTGRVHEPILDKNAKLSFLKQYMADLNLEPGEIMAIGDGANDLAMLEAAGLGIGYRPKPLLAERLDNQILYGDLTAALYAQGMAPKQAP